MAEYRNLGELQYAATRARAAGKEPPPLVIDNDDTHVYQDGECVFRMHPDEVLEQALDLLGIPHEPA